MCGIAGTTHLADRPHLAGLLAAMTHRGPDDAGTYFAERDSVAIGMRRLSILDLSGGHQPMTNETGSIWIVFNGEIFNSPELRRELENQGHQFRTRNSDTEVLIHLYEQHQRDMLKRLNGMFAFVIYDAERRQLFGARDRAGIKPFYYTDVGGRFAFASELKCLLTLPWLSREHDPESLYHYFSLQTTPAPRTILRDVRKLPAGSCFTWDLASQQLRVDRYWKLPIRPDRETTKEQFVERLRSKLTESIQRWTLSDVPLACSLSGGLDSSAVVGIASQLGIGRLKTYSVGFSGANMQEYDELPLARLVAQRWGTEHHEIVLDPRTLLDDLDRMVWHLDEPYGGGLPSWYVFREISSSCKVALTGTGGDELFGNYQKWSPWERNRWRQGRRMLKQSWQWKNPGIMRNWLRFPDAGLFPRYLPDAVKDSLLFDRLHRPSVTTETLLQSLWNESRADNPRDAIAAIDFQLQLPEEFLSMTDRFSMAHGVEARVPFLDHELIELAFTVPAELRTRSGDPKYLEREIVAPYVPAELLRARKKGFVLPLREWTRHELRDMVGDLLGPQALRDAGLSTRVWDDIVQPHLDERRDWTQQVWTLLMYQLWQQVVQVGIVSAGSLKTIKIAA